MTRHDLPIDDRDLTPSFDRRVLIGPVERTSQIRSAATMQMSKMIPPASSSGSGDMAGGWATRAALRRRPVKVSASPLCVTDSISRCRSYIMAELTQPQIRHTGAPPASSTAVRLGVTLEEVRSK